MVLINLFWFLSLILFNFAEANEEIANFSVNSADQETVDNNRSDSIGDKNHFDISEFNIVGNSVLPTTAIEQAVYPFLGEKKTIDDAEEARTALEKTYHDAGYLTVLVNIPEQKVDGGIVKLEVTQSTVDRLRVTGARYFSLGKIKEGVPELAEGNVPHFPTVQKELAALNRSPDRKVTPVMKPGATPGTLQIELKVEDQLPLHGSVSLNDRYSADTTRWRATANIKWDNLWQLQHSASITVTSSPEDVSETQVYSGTYSIPLDSGDYLAFYGVISKTDVAAVGTLNVLGNGTIAGARYIHPLPSLPNFYHTLTAGVDYKDFDQTIALLGSDSFNTPIQYTPFIVGWDGVWAEKMSTTKLGINLNFNVRDFMSSSDTVFDTKRLFAKSNYAFMRSNVEYDWRFASGAHLDFRLSGQLTDQPLISNEQFAIGGADTVRGYLESEALGDKGYSAGAELHSASLAKYVNQNINDLHVLGFVETGEVVVQQAQASQVARRDLLGAGFGVRFSNGHWSAKLDFAQALKDGSRTKSGDNRAHAFLEYAF